MIDFISPPRGRRLRDASALRVHPLAVLGIVLSITSIEARQFRTTTNTVPVYVTVTDVAGKPIRDLVAADFQIDDNGDRQVITVFKNDIQPISIAVLLDSSPSLFPVFGKTVSAVTEFAKRLIPGDRACLGTFSQAVTLDPELSSDAGTLVKRLDAATLWPAGTAVWDAVDAGRAAIQAEGGKRVILIVTDGVDNASRIDPNQARTNIQKSGILVYFVGVRGRMGLDTSEMGALANSTGGRSIEIKNPDEVGATMQQVADELHSQYALGFSPTKLDNRLHRLEVKVKRPGTIVRTARMYFAARAEGR